MAVKYIEQIKEMREKGMTYDEISKEIGITRQQVWYTAKAGGIAGLNSIEKSKKVIYKGVQEWLIEHNMKLHDFCIKCGEDFGSNSRTWKFLTGDHKGDFYMIKNILSATNMTFEEAFGEVVDEGKEKSKD